ncbi:Protein CBG11676 [Caenorhabditis briggsae]|uniref:Protein CBG11676 n=1 Tax=Caenorhabditis briggsae TaxID=6238 RepID=A8XDS5_CAEBR|nr:Protein CBG11676 [Caenorhabditis briggsae]CAP30795.1 Protein CBG11676 [Caenorhabditis briggsae]
MEKISFQNIHTYKSAFFMVMDYRSRGIPAWMAEILICLMCGCFGMTIYGIAVHFIYRLFALERQTVKDFFDLEIDNCAYAGAAFYPLDKNGTRITVIPVFLLFIPFGTIFILPIFEINCQFLSAPITFVYALYPAVDPLPTLYFVDYYRNAITEFFDFLRCRSPRVGVYEEEPSRSDNRI